MSGPTALVPPAGAKVVRTVSAEEMLAAVDAEVGSAQVFVSVAAVADYRVAKPSEQKIKKSDQALTIELLPTVDILASVAARPNPPFCVGFAAESHNLDQFAEDKRRRKKLPLLVGNVAQDAIGAEDSEVVLYDDAGRHPLPRAPKIEQARALVRHIARLYARTREP